MLDENTDKLLRNTSMAKKKEVNSLNIVVEVLLVVGYYGLIGETSRW